MEIAPTTRLKIQPKQQLSVEDLQGPFKVQGQFLIVDYSVRGWKLRHPVKVPIEKVLAAREKGLVSYIVRSFSSERPGLIPLVFDNKSLIQLARHFLRHGCGSPHSLYSYTNTIQRYSTYLGYAADLIIADVKPSGAIPDPARVESHKGFLEDYIAQLQDEGLSPGRVHCYAKHIKTFYRTNGVKIELTEPLSRRTTYKDRAPKPEELMRLLEIADPREKVIVSLLSLGAFREETLSKMCFRHVREDLEKGTVPIHVHVEAEIVKGKYGDYDTFLGQEAVEYLKTYMQLRRQGSPDGRCPPEEINGNSALIRDKTRHTARPIGSKQIRKIVHELYAKAGLLKEPIGRMYDLRVHSLRKFFKTQLLALGVQSDYVDYMMGHTVDTYHDIQMKGVEFLRNIYAASGLSIKPKTRVSKIEALKEIIRAWGLNPDQVLAREALTQGATIHIDSETRMTGELQVLSKTLKQLIRQESSQANESDE